MGLRRAQGLADGISLSLIVAVVAYAFWPSLHNGFVQWDDPLNITENPHFRGLGWEHLEWMFTSLDMGPYIPLTWISLALDYRVWGLNPVGYHLTSILFHAGNAVLVYVIAKRLLGIGWGRQADTSPGIRFGALAAALFFGVHPLRVESVAWVTERRDVLCGFFFLAAVLLHLESSRLSGSEARSLRVAAWISYLLSLLAKAASVPLPLLLVVLDAYLAKKRQPELRFLSLDSLRRSLADKLPYFALAIPFAAVALLGQARHSIMASPGAFGLLDRIAVAGYGIVFYVGKTVWSRDLSPLYDLPLSLDPFEPRFVASASIVIVATASALWLVERWPALLAAWAWYVIALLPTSGVLQTGFQIAADRYTYIPCLSWAVLGGAACVRADDWLRRRGPGPRCSLAVGVAGLVGALVLSTRAQTLVWRDSLSLWKHVVELQPDSMTGHNNLGAALAQQGRIDEAIRHFRFVLARDPQRLAARLNLDKALRVTGERSSIRSSGGTTRSR